MRSPVRSDISKHPFLSTSQLNILVVVVAVLALAVTAVAQTWTYRANHPSAPVVEWGGHVWRACDSESGLEHCQECPCHNTVAPLLPEGERESLLNDVAMRSN
jgi:hypothetical protein